MTSPPTADFDAAYLQREFEKVRADVKAGIVGDSVAGLRVAMIPWQLEQRRSRAG